MALTVSIVIVSQQRPEALRRCLIAVLQLRYPSFEVVIVADSDSCALLRRMPQSGHIKLIPFDQANISVARNLGIRAAAGEVIAFIDDDAVPEPTWPRFLAAPFEDLQVAAVGGFVRGRNGISWQNRANCVDRTGLVAPIAVDPDRATVLTPSAGMAIKTEGTNMAVRRTVLAELGGFDPRFRFFLDETDLNLRLAAQGLCTAIAPHAEVHHGFDASARRRADRVPTDLYEIGASWAVFLGKHCEPDERNPAWRRVQAAERRRALKHLISGALEPRDVRRLLRGLSDGYRDGEARKPVDMPVLPDASEPFLPCPTGVDARSVVVSGRNRRRAELRHQARQEVEAGNTVTLIRLSRTALFHRVTFSTEGYWDQTGGIFGKSERAHRLISACSLDRRVQSEVDRVGIVRGLV